MYLFVHMHKFVGKKHITKKPSGFLNIYYICIYILFSYCYVGTRTVLSFCVVLLDRSSWNNFSVSFFPLFFGRKYR